MRRNGSGYRRKQRKTVMAVKVDRPRGVIYHEGEGWWFWDEVGLDKYGPFKTEQSAGTMVAWYAKTLDKGASIPGHIQRGLDNARWVRNEFGQMVHLTEYVERQPVPEGEQITMAEAMGEDAGAMIALGVEPRTEPPADPEGFTMGLDLATEPDHTASLIHNVKPATMPDGSPITREAVEALIVELEKVQADGKQFIQLDAGTIIRTKDFLDQVKAFHAKQSEPHTLRLTYTQDTQGARVFLDGAQWCALLGADLVEGVAGFASTPQGAVDDLQRELDERKSRPDMVKLARLDMGEYYRELRRLARIDKEVKAGGKPEEVQRKPEHRDPLGAWQRRLFALVYILMDTHKAPIFSSKHCFRFELWVDNNAQPDPVVYVKYYFRMSGIRRMLSLFHQVNRNV